jgi:hypothetical protein
MRKFSALAVGIVVVVGLNFVRAGGEAVELGGLTSKTPEGWKKQKPSNTLRKFQFLVPKVDGDTEDADLAVFAIGGNKKQNIERWKAAFLAPKGKTIDDVAKVEEYKVGKVASVYCLDITGTYKYKKMPGDAREKEQLKENYRRFTVLFDTAEDSFTITMVGPAKTMAKNKEAFDSWIKAFK